MSSASSGGFGHATLKIVQFCGFTSILGVVQSAWKSRTLIVKKNIQELWASALLVLCVLQIAHLFLALGSGGEGGQRNSANCQARAHTHCRWLSQGRTRLHSLNLVGSFSFCSEMSLWLIESTSSTCYLPIFWRHELHTTSHYIKLLLYNILIMVFIYLSFQEKIVLQIYSRNHFQYTSVY